MALTLEYVTNIKGSQGVPGPIGLPGVNAVANDAASAGYIGTRGSATSNALEALNGYRLFGAGIDPTGVADSTVALQAIINANPGETLRLPGGVYKITSLTLNAGQTIEGAGQQDWRDRFSIFGSAGWANNANFNGTVIRSTITTGVAIVWCDTAEVNSGGLTDLTLIGPGSGTSTGIEMGSTTITVVNANVRNVKIGNFFVGMKTNYVNEGSFYDLMIRGCVTGLNMAYFSNQNAFYMLDIQWCGAGLVISADTVSNTFYSMIGQSNSGTAVSIAGIKNIFYNPYFENNTVRAVDFLPTAKGNAIHDPFCNGVSDSIRVQALAVDNVISGVGGYGTVITIQDYGTRTYLQGRLSGLLNAGVNPVIVDPGFAGSAFGAWTTYPATLAGTGVTLGDGTAVGRYRLVGKTVEFEVTVTCGSTTSFGTAQVTVGLPFPLLNAASLSGEYSKNGGTYYSLWGLKIVGGTLRLYAYGTGGAATPVNNTAPAAMGAGNVLIARGIYEAS